MQFFFLNTNNNPTPLQSTRNQLNNKDKYKFYIKLIGWVYVVRYEVKFLKSSGKEGTSAVASYIFEKLQVNKNNASLIKLRYGSFLNFLSTSLFEYLIILNFILFGRFFTEYKILLNFRNSTALLITLQPSFVLTKHLSINRIKNNVREEKFKKRFFL